MAESLNISHLDVIEPVHIDFGEGLVAVTGKTNADKTMVLSNLQLLPGARADTALVCSGTDHLSADGIFSVNEEVTACVEEVNGPVESSEPITGRLVRIIGRSHAHPGSRPVSTSILTDAVGSMVTIHG